MRIELPGNLGSSMRTMKMMGMGAQMTQLETSIRQNPAGAATSLAKKVFGAL